MVARVYPESDYRIPHTLLAPEGAAKKPGPKASLFYVTSELIRRLCYAASSRIHLMLLAAIPTSPALAARALEIAMAALPLTLEPLRSQRFRKLLVESPLPAA
jgi:hypothetical protein